MKPIIEYKLKEKNQILKIYQDESPESSNDWENDDIFLVYKHRQFQVDREGFEPRKIFTYLQKENDAFDFSEYYIFTVYAYIHSGISLSLAHNGDRFDTSSTGFILVSKKHEHFDYELQRKSNEELKDKSDEEIAEYYAEGLIKTWNTYLEGNVYGFKLFELEKHWKISEIKLNEITSAIDIIGNNLFKETAELLEEENEIDSCWGFYEENSYKDGYENIFDHLGLKIEELEEIQ